MKIIMQLKMAFCMLVSISGVFGSINQCFAASPEAETCWGAKDRAAKVAKLIPGRKIPDLTREALFADWTRQQVKQWKEKHPSALSANQEYQRHVETSPTDAELLKDFPRHIAPLARVRSGKPKNPNAAVNALYSYCPMCQSNSLSLRYDRKNEYHATTVCCNTELYGRPKDFPANYPLRPAEQVAFRHLDGTTVNVPCTIFKDKDGVVWELYIKTLFDQRRWLDIGGDLIGPAIPIDGEADGSWWTVENELCSGWVTAGFGKYQNGGILLNWIYWEIVALAQSGDAAGVWDRMKRFAARDAKTNWFEGENSFTMDGQPFDWGSEPYLSDQVNVPAALVDGFLGGQCHWQAPAYEIITLEITKRIQSVLEVKK